MPYNYQTEKPFLFTDEGSRKFLAVRDHVQALLKQAGAVRMAEAMRGFPGGGTNWQMLACVDRLVEIGELLEVPRINYGAGQDRIFVRKDE